MEYLTQISTGLVIALGSSLLNFIALKAVNSITGSSRNFLWINKKKNLTELKTSIDFEELKKRVRIVVIDDEDSFPIELFQSEGYAIDKWNKVNDYGKLESGFYEIIVLDIKGVAIHISEDDGLGVLESLKQKNPAQIIIAYSQHTFDLSKARFWELADEKIAKPSDFLKIKNIIDNLINTKFVPDRYIERLHSLLKKNDINNSAIQKIDIAISKYIKDKNKPDWNKILPTVNNKAEIIRQIISISNTLLKFFQ